MNGQIDTYVWQLPKLCSCSLYATPLSHAPTHPICIGDKRSLTHCTHWHNVYRGLTLLSKISYHKVIKATNF